MNANMEQQERVNNASLSTGLWSRKSRHPSPGNFDYPTPTLGPTLTFSCISYLK